MSDDASELEQILGFVYQCPAALLRIRRDGEILLASAAACGMLLAAIPGGDLVNLFDVLDPVAPALRPAVASFGRRTGTIFEQHQARLPGPAGTTRILAITIIAMDEDTCAVALHDVTRVVEQERRLELAERRLQAIIDSVHDYAIFTLDAQGNVDSWNRSLGRLTQLEAAAVHGRPLSHLTATMAPSQLAELLARARDAGWAEYAASHRRGPSEFWGEAVLTPLLSAGEEQVGFGVVLRDATAKRRYEQELLRLARMDPLTGVYNRRAFVEAAELERARPDAELSVVILDVDHFKSVNDHHGHGAGDDVLRALAAAATGALRAGDVLARLGGEEFAVLVPGASRQDAAALAERIREAVAGVEISTPAGPLRVTVSAGVASSPPGACEPFEQLLHRADEALYAAKRGGRDRVEVAGPPTPGDR